MPWTRSGRDVTGSALAAGSICKALTVVGRLAKASFHITGVPIAATPASAATTTIVRPRLPARLAEGRGTTGTAIGTGADFGRIACRASVDSSEANEGGVAAGGGT